MRNDERLAYVAGVIDGDGSIYIIPVDKDPSWSFMRGVALNMQSKRCVENVAGILGGTFNWDDSQQAWRYFSGSTRAAKVCSKIAPFMTIKDRQAGVVIRFEKLMEQLASEPAEGKRTGIRREQSLQRRFELCNEIQVLNQSVITHDPDDTGLSLKAKTAYAAGLIDAEGMISILRSGPRGRTPAIRLEMTDRTPLVRLHRIFGGRLAPEKRKTVTGLTVYRWEVTGMNARTVCKAILPYLKVKREQAEIAIRYHLNVCLWVQRTGCGRHSLIPLHVIRKREEWINKIHSLNGHKPRAGAETKSEHSDKGK